VWVISLLENPRINLISLFKKSLFNRLGLLIVVFTIALTTVLFYQFHYSFSTQDSIIDAHENYYYSRMVQSWNNPPDTTLIIEELANLKIWCGIFKRDTTEYGVAFPGKTYWSNLPATILTKNFISWTISTDFEKIYDISIPLEVFFGEINTMPVTVVDNGEYLFYLVIDYIPPSDWYNVLFAIVLSIVFILGIHFFIKRYLKPVQLMKNRIESLEQGDLKSKIDIIGEDELAELSKSMNKMIKEINLLLENKHQLLLEVSHELRSPLARMQFLIEMLPKHKNTIKLREEVNFLESMIDNLLLSDRLSMPYSKLDLKNIKISKIVKKTLELFPNINEKVIVNNLIPDEIILVDETKFIIAIRNLLDNALKYGEEKNIYLNIEKNDIIEFHVKDLGGGISNENINNITKPFFRGDDVSSTQGFGLGLTICKKIIESHKGQLSIQSKMGQGSIFTLQLPTN